MFLSFELALKNYRREWLFSACAVFSLAAFLVPLLTLMGVKDGILDTLTRRLIENPRNLELTPVGTGQFTADFFQELKAHPDTAFVIPETRNISASIQIHGPHSEPRWLDLAPTAPGEPLLSEAAEKSVGLDDDGNLKYIYISAGAAEKTGLQHGDRVKGLVSRKIAGRLETAMVDLIVTGVLPRHVVSRDIVYCQLKLMEMTEDYRNGFAVPELGWPGREKPDIPPRYAGFRLYAGSLDGVERLRVFLTSKGLEVYTKAEEIAVVRSLDHSFTVVFLVLAAVVGLGAFASVSSSALDQVAKMRRSLAIMRLLGFSSKRLMVFILAQAALTGLLAAFIADGLFLIIAAVLNNYFGGSLGFGERICWLSTAKLAITAGLSLFFMLAASAAAGIRLSGIEPSEGMRDV